MQHATATRSTAALGALSLWALTPCAVALWAWCSLALTSPLASTLSSTLSSTWAVGSARAEEPARPAPAWAHDYKASDTFGPQLFAVRELSAECKTRLGFHLTSRRLFTPWYARSRKSNCR
jgi:hypothetical protein